MKSCHLVHSLEPITNRASLLDNKVRTLIDLIDDTYVSQVGYAIDSSLICWIHEWKKISIEDPELDAERYEFIDELNDLLIRVKDNLIQSLRDKIR